MRHPAVVASQWKVGCSEGMTDTGHKIHNRAKDVRMANIYSYILRPVFFLYLIKLAYDDIKGFIPGNSFESSVTEPVE